ncbi:MAG: rhodanese-like domain-containing protein [Phycisphaerae bacterium]
MREYRLISICCLAVFAWGCQQPGSLDQGGGRFEKIKTAAEMKSRMDADDNLMVIHALDADHYSEGHIPGAVNIDYEKMTPDMLPENKDQPLVFYCVSRWCPVSKSAAGKAASWGYKNVWAYTGGIKDWKKAGMKVATGN